MDKWVCSICSYVYDPAVGDPENGINPGTSFEDLPDDWVCPLCSVGKEHFEKEQHNKQKCYFVIKKNTFYVKKR